jgi:uncharacterized BrkB/YihY/UPF0761 family membrane protein
MPLFALMPVCVTFLALALLAFLVVVFNVYLPNPPSDTEERPRHPPEWVPHWWVVALIPVVVAVIFVLVLLFAPEW